MTTDITIIQTYFGYWIDMLEKTTRQYLEHSSFRQAEYF